MRAYFGVKYTIDIDPGQYVKFFDFECLCDRFDGCVELRVYSGFKTELFAYLRILVLYIAH